MQCWHHTLSFAVNIWLLLSPSMAEDAEEEEQATTSSNWSLLSSCYMASRKQPLSAAAAGMVPHTAVLPLRAILLGWHWWYRPGMIEISSRESREG
jgi:hypothetical protein